MSGCGHLPHRPRPYWDGSFPSLRPWPTIWMAPQHEGPSWLCTPLAPHSNSHLCGICAEPFTYVSLPLFTVFPPPREFNSPLDSPRHLLPCQARIRCSIKTSSQGTNYCQFQAGKFWILRLIRQTCDRWGLWGTGRGSDLSKVMNRGATPGGRSPITPPRMPAPPGTPPAGGDALGSPWGSFRCLRIALCQFLVIQASFSPYFSQKLNSKQLRQLWSWDSSLVEMH